MFPSNNYISVYFHNNLWCVRCTSFVFLKNLLVACASSSHHSILVKRVICFRTSQPDSRSNVESQEQGKHSHPFYNTTIICIPTGLLRLIEEPILGPWSKENLLTASIILQLCAIPTGLLSLIEEPLLGQWSKENTYADTIIIQNSTGFLSLI